MARIDESQVRARIQKARKQAGLTQEKLAELLEVIPRTVQNYEARTGMNANVPYDRLGDIAAFTGVSVAWLLSGDDDVAERVNRLERLLLEAARLLTAERPPEGPEREAYDLLAELVRKQTNGTAPHQDDGESPGPEPDPPQDAPER